MAKPGNANDREPAPGPRAPVPPLVPVVVQDAAGKDVLMLAYADREALRRALAEGRGWYFSRSRRALWRKGETSGNVQEVVRAFLDCDRDAVLLQVRQHGAACHTGQRSCFHHPLDLDTLDDARFEQFSDLGFLSQLERVIADRDATRPESSYTASLLAGGKSRVLQKVGEEAVEFVLAAASLPQGRAEGRGAIRAEAADLIFHLLVAMRACGLTLAEVVAELIARHRGPG